MANLSVTYYTGEWSAQDREAVRSVLAEQGFQITGESDGTVKGIGTYPPQLLLDINTKAVKAAREEDADVTLPALVVALHRLFDHFRDRKPNVILTIGAVRYVVSDEQSIDDIPIEYRTSVTRRPGERWWRDGRWQTFEEVYGT